MKKIYKSIKTIKYCYRNLSKLLEYYFISLCWYLSDDVQIGLERIKIICKIIFYLCFFFTRNPDLGLDLLYLLSNNLTHDFVYINSSSDNNNPFGIGSSNTNNSGPSNPNPFSGNEAIYEIENNRNRQQQSKNQHVFSSQPNSQMDDRRVILDIPYEGDPNPNLTPNLNRNNHEIESSKPRNKRNKPKFTNNVNNETTFYHYDPETNVCIYPESLHLNKPFVINKMRSYYEDGIRYSYNYTSSDPSNYFCKISYPDGSTCKTYDVLTVINNIKFHKLHIKLGYETKDKFAYSEYYKQNLDKHRKNLIQDKLNTYKNINSNRKIGPNIRPKDIHNESILDKAKRLRKLIPKKQIKKKYLFVDSN